MSLTVELDDAVERIKSLFEADTDADTNLTGWSDEPWRVKAIYTDDLILPKLYPVIYVSGTGQERRLVAADSQYDVKMLAEIIIEAEWRDPMTTTNSKRELIKLARRAEEVLRRNRLDLPYWYRSVFHELAAQGEPLRMELYRLKVEQRDVIGAVLLWHGYRRVQLT